MPRSRRGAPSPSRALNGLSFPLFQRASTHSVPSASHHVPRWLLGESVPENATTCLGNTQYVLVRETRRDFRILKSRRAGVTLCPLGDGATDTAGRFHDQPGVEGDV